MYTYIYWYPRNKFFCWHGRKHRAANQIKPAPYGLAGTEIYCTKCYRKHTAVYFDPKRQGS